MSAAGGDICLEAVSKKYGAGSGPVLGPIDLDIPAGGLFVVTGPNGSGKSTLLGIVAGMIRPSTGRVWVAGMEVSGLSTIRAAWFRRHVVGMVFQRPRLVSGMSVLDNVLLPALPDGAPRRVLEERGLSLLAEAGLDREARWPVERLSVGRAQAVSLVRAMMNAPPVIVADEPTASLDATAAADLMERFSRLASQGRTLLMASHDPRVLTAVPEKCLALLTAGRLTPASRDTESGTTVSGPSGEWP